MIHLKDGSGKGSCRSYGGFNLFSALESCSDLLDGFGGHELAAGFTIPEENIDTCLLYTSLERTETNQLDLVAFLQSGGNGVQGSGDSSLSVLLGNFSGSGHGGDQFSFVHEYILL